jgi:hypothetical protein
MGANSLAIILLVWLVLGGGGTDTLLDAGSVLEGA